MPGPPPPPPPPPPSATGPPTIDAVESCGSSKPKLTHAEVFKRATAGHRERHDRDHSIAFVDVPEADAATRAVMDEARASSVTCDRCGAVVHASNAASHADSHASEILEGWLYLGNHFNGRSRREVERDGITRVVNAATADQAPNWHADIAVYHDVELLDKRGENIFEHLHRAVEFIESARAEGHSVLVHCVQGISRSTTIVMAYLVKHGGLSLREAYEHVKARRSIARPNKGFFRQLVKFEVEVRGGETSFPPEEYDALVGMEINEERADGDSAAEGAVAEVEMEAFDGDIAAVEAAVGVGGG